MGSIVETELKLHWSERTLAVHCTTCSLKLKRSHFPLCQFPFAVESLVVLSSLVIKPCSANNLTKERLLVWQLTSRCSTAHGDSSVLSKSTEDGSAGP